MAKFTYDVTIPGVGTVPVSSDTQLSNVEAYQRAVQMTAQSKAPQPPNVDYSLGAEAARSAVGQGMLLGFGDELEAAVRTGSVSGQQYESLRNELRAQQERFKKENPALSFATEFGGGMVIPGGIALKGGKVGTNLIKEVAIGAGLGAAQGAGEATSLAEVPSAAAKSGLFSAGATGVLSGVNRAISPRVQQSAKDLSREGVTLTPGSAFGGTIQTIEQSAESVPLVGNYIKSARKTSFEDFNRAAYNRVLQNLDTKAKLPQDLMGRDALAYVEGQISNRYQSIVPNLTFQFDPRVEKQFNGILKRYTSSGKMGEAQQRQLEQIIGALKADFAGNKTISGQLAQAKKQDIAQLAEAYKKATGSERILGEALGDLQAVYMNTLRNQNPKYAAELKKADSAFADFVRVQTAMAKTKGEEAVFTPNQLAQAVREQDKSMRKGAYAKGQARMQDLADKGVSVLGNKVPDSGTVSRGLVAGGLTGAAGYVDPLYGLGTAFMTLPYTKTGQKFLFSPRNPTVTNLSERVRAGAPYAVPGLLNTGENYFLMQQE